MNYDEIKQVGEEVSGTVCDSHGVISSPPEQTSFFVSFAASQSLSDSAWMAALRHNDEEALRLYSEAADAAGTAFALLDRTKKRAFNILLIHWAALLRKSGRFEEAKSVCGEYLMWGDDDVSARTRRELAVVYGLAFWRIDGVGE
jgi:hypothetical protein